MLLYGAFHRWIMVLLGFLAYIFALYGKASFDILTSSPLIVTLVNPVQLENAYLSINVTLDRVVTLVSPVHLLNRYLPIDVTLDGMVTLVNPVQPSNA